ncbi:hypothetical protein NECAME_15011 [Necator americanus]|nr:hypothetical protein NECAME_15011 [Necator americanus]ETN69923.1 hypothetical protein NECAME_15011 [Necator americanus]
MCRTGTKSEREMIDEIMRRLTGDRRLIADEDQCIAAISQSAKQMTQSMEFETVSSIGRPQFPQML